MALCIIQVIELLGPHHPAETLAHNILRVSGEVTGNDCGVEFIGLAPALRKYAVKGGESLFSLEEGVG
jgi:hypothetical protein